MGSNPTSSFVYLEWWLSGLKLTVANCANLNWFRGFESHPFLHFYKKDINMAGYSIDVFKKAAFSHELDNILLSEELRQRLGSNHSILVSYFKERIKEIDKEYG